MKKKRMKKTRKEKTQKPIKKDETETKTLMFLLVIFGLLAVLGFVNSNLIYGIGFTVVSMLVFWSLTRQK